MVMALILIMGEQNLLRIRKKRSIIWNRQEALLPLLFPIPGSKKQLGSIRGKIGLESPKKHIQGEKYLADIISKADADARPILEKFKQVYLERAIWSGQPLVLARAQLEREIRKAELDAKVKEIEDILKKQNIAPDIIDLSMPKIFKVQELYDSLTDLKQLTAVFDLLPEWAEALASLAVKARDDAYAADKMGQHLQDYVNEIYALTGGFEIPSEEMNEFINEVQDIDSDMMRLKKLLSEAINYMPFYADVSRNSLTGDGSDFLPESTERFVLELREEIENSARLNIYDMQEEITELLEEAYAIIEQYDHPADTRPTIRQKYC